MVNILPANAGDVRDAGSIPRSGRFHRGGHGNPLHYSCLGNPMDSGAWWATVCRVTKSRTQLKRLSKHTQDLNMIVKDIWNSRKRMEFSVLSMNSVKVQRQKWKYCHMGGGSECDDCFGGENFILGCSG